MILDDKQAITIASNFLASQCIEAAEPLWELDDFGNEIYCDIGCANWVYSEMFEIQDEPQPRVDRDDEGVCVIIQALVKWSHWNYKATREYYVSLMFEDGNWAANSAFDWEDVEIGELE